MTRGHAKGSQYERDFCRTLSLWWSNNERDDCFWRTQGSGARATSRSKIGKTTKGHYGDVGATDSKGSALLRIITFSLKRGYSNKTPFDLLDKRPLANQKKPSKQLWEHWIEETQRDAKSAKSFSWAIIAQRDKRYPIVMMPKQLFNRIGMYGGETSSHPLRGHITLINQKLHVFKIFCLHDFFQRITPLQIRALDKRIRGVRKTHHS